MRSIIAACLALCSCASPPQQGVTFPPLPPWVSTGKTITAQQVASYVASYAPTAQLNTSDGTFTLLDHDFAIQLIAWAARQLREKQNAGLFRYDPEAHDCDKFAKVFTYLAEIAAGKAKAHAQPLVARIFVRHVNDWAGIPGGAYSHAVVAIATTRGIIVVEPQSTAVGGCWVPLERYPNREHIWKVTIGG